MQSRASRGLLLDVHLLFYPALRLLLCPSLLLLFLHLLSPPERHGEPSEEYQCRRKDPAADKRGNHPGERKKAYTDTDSDKEQTCPFSTHVAAPILDVGLFVG